MNQLICHPVAPERAAQRGHDGQVVSRLAREQQPQCIHRPGSEDHALCPCRAVSFFVKVPVVDYVATSGGIRFAHDSPSLAQGPNGDAVVEDRGKIGEVDR